MFIAIGVLVCMFSAILALLVYIRETSERKRKAWHEECLLRHDLRLHRIRRAHPESFRAHVCNLTHKTVRH